MLLLIFDLDDSSGKPLCSFGEGEHIIGRGAPLKCLDKRISRKHAQIEVSEDAATITAKHEINPCFYRAAGGKHISILKYNIPMELTSGDKFGFFPDKHWFLIKITTNTDNLQNNRTSLGVNENLNETHESDKSNNNLRNQEASTINDSNLNESLQNESTAISNANGVEIKVEEEVENQNNCIETNEENVNRSTEINIESNSERNEEDAARSIQNGGEGSAVNVSNTESNIQRDEEDSIANINNCGKENTTVNNTSADTSLERNGDYLPLNINNGEINTESNENNSNDRNVEIEPDLHLNPNNIEDTLETDDRDISSNPIRSIHSADTTLAENESLPDINNEDLPYDAENMQIDGDSNPSGQNFTNLRIKQEPDDDFSNVSVNQQVIDDATVASNTASTSGTSGTSMQKVYRDRCWYGATCYRRNDDHRLKFSHPSDNDYDTDPEDTRPSCPYGGDCYRRNKDHRKNFKHSRKTKPNQQPPSPPSPKKRKKKPSPAKTKKRKNKRSTDKDDEGDDGDGLSQSNIVGTKRRRNNKTLTESPLDDYDLNDPFLDDSDEEFHIDTDASESDDDSQSQNI